MYKLASTLCAAAFTLGFTMSVTAQPSANAKWFRYYENGVPQTAHTVTQKHIDNGYEELDASFRVIKTVKPYSSDAVAQKKADLDNKKEAELAKRKLLRTYGSSERAMRKRTELLADIASKRSFAQQQLNVATAELNTELGTAANLEKNGKSVPDTIQQNIEAKKTAVQTAKSTIDDVLVNQMKRVDDLTLDVRRLRQIERIARGN